MHPITRAGFLKGSLAAAALGSVRAGAQEPRWQPAIDGEWWNVAGNPDLGAWTTKAQEPVDFGVWQAKDGTWQLWSCIRKTACGGNTRLFYRWEGQGIEDHHWAPKGIAMTAEEQYGEAPGGLQAPHVIVVDGVYQMFYGNWRGICRATSEDGKVFRRVVNPEGSTQVFSEDKPNEPRFGTRDPMVLHDGGKFYCYYTARRPDNYESASADFCRTSEDLEHWSDSSIAFYGGRSGTRHTDMECPHVVKRKGAYYLFNTQRYKDNPKSCVYRSMDPLDFGDEDNTHFACEMPVAAPEIVQHEGQDYIVALKPALDGIRAARLKWVRV